MRLKDKRILVTGSSGFVGRHLVKRLKEKGARTVAFDITAGKDVMAKWTTPAKPARGGPGAPKAAPNGVAFLRGLLPAQGGAAGRGV